MALPVSFAERREKLSDAAIEVIPESVVARMETLGMSDVLLGSGIEMTVQSSIPAWLRGSRSTCPEAATWDDPALLVRRPSHILLS